VSSVAGVLTARLSATDAAANHIVARVQSYPLIFTGALTIAATTLGARYLGEAQQSRFLQLGIALLSWAVLLGLICGVGLFFFVRVFILLTGSQCEKLKHKLKTGCVSVCY